MTNNQQQEKIASDADVRALCLATIALSGRGPVRRTLERLVNRGLVTFEQARGVWEDAFGGQLIAVPDRRAAEAARA